jgi:hypothetical protein
MDTSPITLTFVGYEITGIAELALWGGGTKVVQMRPFMMDEPTRPNLLRCLNSADLEVEWIRGGICHIRGVWADELGNKIKRFHRTLTVGKISQTTREFQEDILA